jgi:hypothetical protein
MAENFIQGKLLEAASKIASGDYQGGLLALGEGSHTVQDKAAHNLCTLIGHLSRDMIERDLNPSKQFTEMLEHYTKEYIDRFWSIMKDYFNLSDKRIDEIKQNLKEFKGF